MLNRWHIVKRTDISRGKALLLRVAAVLLALLTGGVFLWTLGQNPFSVYQTMASGALGSVTSTRETVKLAIPLCVTGVAVTLAFRMKFWNIGAEGQICAGAIAATFFALNFSYLPQALLLVLMGAAGVVAGALWGLAPAYCKARFGTNETLFTLMLNYVAVFIIQYLQEGPWKDPRSGFPKVVMFEKSARLPMVFGVHIGWIVALAVVALAYVYIRYTKQGFELTVVGENENTARYAGMNVARVVIRTMLLSAGLCGLVGMLQASGADKTLTSTVAGGVGFTAISVAYLAQLQPFAILVVAVLFACLEKGGGTIQSVYNISPAATDIFQGIILFFVLGCEFFVNYRIVSKEGGAVNG